jgi:hypothetical protein
VSSEPTQNSVISERLKTAISDLRSLQGLLRSDDLPACVLTDFRDALNRVRNAAWAAQQSVAAKVSGQGSAAVASLLAGERVRAAYQLCRAITADLSNDEIEFQKGQLSELRGVVAELAAKLKDRV